MIEAVRQRSEAREALEAAEAEAEAAGEAAPTHEADGVEITGERSWAEKDAALREAAVDLEESSVPAASE